MQEQVGESSLWTERMPEQLGKQGHAREGCRAIRIRTKPAFTQEGCRSYQLLIQKRKQIRKSFTPSNIRQTSAATPSIDLSKLCIKHQKNSVHATQAQQTPVLTEDIVTSHATGKIQGKKYMAGLNSKPLHPGSTVRRYRTVLHRICSAKQP